MKIHASRDLFAEINLISLRTRNLGRIVQSDTELTPEEFLAWQNDVHGVIESLRKWGNTVVLSTRKKAKVGS